jgi:Na+-transporting NADH:ubiquinone oxidoreductase subunit NqrD
MIDTLRLLQVRLLHHVNKGTSVRRNDEAIEYNCLAPNISFILLVLIWLVDDQKERSWCVTMTV